VRRLITGLALAAGAVAFLAMTAAGMFMAGIAQSGTRSAGLLLILGGLVSIGALLFLIFAPPRYFKGASRRMIGAAAAAIAFVPVAAIAVGAIAFAGVPFGSRTPSLDWSVFAVGVGLAAGAIAIVALAYLRLKTSRETVPSSVMHTAPGHAAPDARYEVHDDIRIKRV
jgi:hypothetical protein